MVFLFFKIFFDPKICKTGKTPSDWPENVFCIKINSVLYIFFRFYYIAGPDDWSSDPSQLSQRPGQLHPKRFGPFIRREGFTS